MIHQRRSHPRLMLDMTVAAGLDRRMECRRLTGQYRCVTGMTDDARRRFDPTLRCVAGLALVRKKHVLRGKIARSDGIRPNRYRSRARFVNRGNQYRPAAYAECQ